LEPLALLFLCDPQSHQELHDAQRHVGHHGGPREHEANGLELNEELRADSRVADGARRPVDRARAAERRGVEDSGHERAEDAADGMHAEDIQRVVGPDEPLEPRDPPQAHEPDAEPDRKRAGDTDVAGGRPKPTRLPSTQAPTSPATPALMCTTVPPAKSSAPQRQMRPPVALTSAAWAVWV